MEKWNISKLNKTNDYFWVTETHDLSQRALAMCNEINDMSRNSNEQMAFPPKNKSETMALCQAGMELVTVGMVRRLKGQLCDGRCLRNQILVWLAFKLGTCMKEADALR